MLRWLVLLALLMPAAGAAQAAGERAALLAFEDSTRSISVADSLNRLVVPGIPRGAVGDLPRLRSGFISLRKGELIRQRDALVAAGDLFFGETDHKEWPMPWYGIGRTERELARGKHRFVPARFHPLGFDYNQGAVITFGYALDIDSTFAPAVEGLADAISATTRWGALKVARRTLRHSTVTTPDALRVHARMERAGGGERNSTEELLYRSLVAGGDTALTLFEIAREQFLTGSVEPGRTTYFTAVGSARSDAALSYLRTQLHQTERPEELSGFDTLSIEQRVQVVRAFWTKRDLESGMRDGTRLMQQQQRFELTESSYKRPDMGMTRTPPSLARTQAGRMVTSREQTLAIKEGLGSGPIRKEGEVGDIVKAIFEDAGTLLIPREFLGIGDMQPREFIYLRYGEPDDMAGPFWLYKRDGGNLVVRTDGSYPGRPCDIDVRFCGTTLSELRKQLKIIEESWETVKRTDRSIREFEKVLEPGVQVYGLPSAPGDSGRLLFTFAIPAWQLEPDSLFDGFVYPVRLSLMAAPVDGSFRVDRDTVRSFRSPERLRKGQYIQGTEVLEVPRGRYYAKVVFESMDAARGAVRGRDSVIVEGPDRSLAMSDLVLGKDESGLTWWSGVSRMRLNPSATIEQDEILYLQYQLSGQESGKQYRTELEVFKGENSKEKPLITLSFEETAKGSFEEVQRQVSVRSLGTGVHMVRVSVRDRDGRTLAGRLALIKIDSPDSE